MNLIDTSVWIDYTRGTGSRAHRELQLLTESRPADVLITEPIAMELLLGPTDELAVRRIERLVDSLPSLDVIPAVDFRSAAVIYRAARRDGRTVRNSVDCLIAAIALRHDVTLWHKDADFEAIAAVTGLRHRSLR